MLQYGKQKEQWDITAYIASTPEVSWGLEEDLSSEQRRKHCVRNGTAPRNQDFQTSQGSHDYRYPGYALVIIRRGTKRGRACVQAKRIPTDEPFAACALATAVTIGRWRAVALYKGARDSGEETNDYKVVTVQGAYKMYQQSARSVLRSEGL